MISLNKQPRRVKRMILSLLNPVLLILTFLAGSILVFALYSYLSIGQLIIGLPFSLLVIFLFFQSLIEDFRGEYERLVIRTNRNILSSDFSTETDVVTSFSAGYFLLDNIQLIDFILLSKGFMKLSSFYEESKNLNWHDPHECITTLSFIDNSIIDFIESSKTKKINSISSEVVKGIQEDCQVFISILESLSKNNLPFHLALLSQSGWNGQIHGHYKTLGYCI